MIWLLWLPVTLAAPGVFPLVDPGLFVISGVRTCGGGAGYCLLGLDCTLDEDFLPDDGVGQHCEGLRSAFTPSAHFVCCRAAVNLKPPTVQTTTPLDLLENEVGQVLQKVAESVEAAQRTPSPGVEVRETESEGSTLLEEEVLESSIEGGVLQGEDDSEEGMQNDEEYRDTGYEQEHVSMDEVMNQNDSPPESVNVLQEPKIENTSEEKSTEENSINSDSADSSEEETSSSSEETDSDEVLATTNKSEQKPSPSQESATVSETQNDLKGNVDKDNVGTSTEGVVSTSNKVTQEELETVTVSPEEDVTEQFMTKETLSDIYETELQVFQRDENTNESLSDTINQEAKDKNRISTENPNMSKNQTKPQNITHVNVELTYSKPTKSKTKPLLVIKPTNIESSKPSTEDTRLNVVVLPTLNKKTEENQNSLYNSIYMTDKHPEGGIRTNKTNANSHTDTKAGFATETSVSPVRDSGRPASQGQVNVVCTTTRTTNCSREIRFVFQNRTLCYGSVYSFDWVVTSASCALRIFRAGMLNVSVSPLEGMSEAAVKTIVVHESYAENAGLSGQNMEANNIGLVQLKMSMREWSGCVSCLPQPGNNFTSNCSALTDRPMVPSTNCPTPESCKSSRAEDSTTETALTRCQGRARDMKDDLGFHYLTLACDTLWEPRFSEPPHGSGAPLFCGDVLAGLEASTGMGLMVYTPLVRYLDWLRNNTRTSSPEQHFNLH